MTTLDLLPPLLLFAADLCAFAWAVQHGLRFVARGDEARRFVGR